MPADPLDAIAATIADLQAQVAEIHATWDRVEKNIAEAIELNRKEGMT